MKDACFPCMLSVMGRDSEMAKTSETGFLLCIGSKNIHGLGKSWGISRKIISSGACDISGADMTAVLRTLQTRGPVFTDPKQ